MPPKVKIDVLKGVADEISKVAENSGEIAANTGQIAAELMNIEDGQRMVHNAIMGSTASDDTHMDNILEDLRDIHAAAFLDTEDKRNTYIEIKKSRRLRVARKRKRAEETTGLRDRQIAAGCVHGMYALSDPQPGVDTLEDHFFYFPVGDENEDSIDIEGDAEMLLDPAPVYCEKCK